MEQGEGFDMSQVRKEKSSFYNPGKNYAWILRMNQSIPACSINRAVRCLAEPWMR